VIGAAGDVGGTTGKGGAGGTTSFGGAAIGVGICGGFSGTGAGFFSTVEGISVAEGFTDSCDSR
jgi:hypothetical protein